MERQNPIYQDKVLCEVDRAGISSTSSYSTTAQHLHVAAAAAAAAVAAEQQQQQ